MSFARKVRTIFALAILVKLLSRCLNY